MKLKWMEFLFEIRELNARKEKWIELKYFNLPSGSVFFCKKKKKENSRTVETDSWWKFHNFKKIFTSPNKKRTDGWMDAASFDAI